MTFCVYRMYNDANEAVYIGQSLHPHRVAAHAEREWWPQVATIKVRHYETRDEAMNAERDAIKAESPKHNRQHAMRAAGYERAKIANTAAELLTPEQAADRLASQGLAISGRTLRRWIELDRLSAVRLPSGRYLLSTDVVDALVTQEAS